MKEIRYTFLFIPLLLLSLTACGSIEKNISNPVVESINGDKLNERMQAISTIVDFIEGNNQRDEKDLFESVTIERTIDGDTFELTDGRKVRLIGVNTPESTKEQEIYGKEASAYTKSMLEGKTVYLQKDVSETDQYGRYLRLVWLEQPTNAMDEEEIRAKLFNAILVLNGYAEPSTYEPDTTYSQLFQNFADEARGKNMGLWAFGKNGTTKGDFDN
ncbi:thermonuclease family protein [Mycobacterium sp. Z3061]|uniref:thermonuclease family protein n=1 Tax=Mycobacterium sp. Z3061 TaxID=3073562 RepID=UPI003B5FBC1C